MIGKSESKGHRKRFIKETSELAVEEIHQILPRGQMKGDFPSKEKMCKAQKQEHMKSLVTRTENQR